jgi:hypothetical protein
MWLNCKLFQQICITCLGNNHLYYMQLLIMYEMKLPKDLVPYFPWPFWHVISFLNCTLLWYQCSLVYLNVNFFPTCLRLLWLPLSILCQIRSNKGPYVTSSKHVQNEGCCPTSSSHVYVGLIWCFLKIPFLQGMSIQMLVWNSVL